jgi:hypothetical protein
MSRADRTDEPAQLLRLRGLREERALRRWQQARQQRDAAQDQVLRRRDELHAFDADLAALLRRLAGVDAGVFVRSAAYASARHDDLVYRRERCEYDLIDDEESLAAAQRLLDEAVRVWNAARSRSDAAGELLQRARGVAARAAEQRLERDEPPRTPSQLVGRPDLPSRTAPRAIPLTGARP